MFVVWRTLPSSKQKKLIVTNIREFKSIVFADIYSMPLQMQIIALVAGSKYISIVDAAAFFYQFRMAKQD